MHLVFIKKDNNKAGITESLRNLVSYDFDIDLSPDSVFVSLYIGEDYYDGYGLYIFRPIMLPLGIQQMKAMYLVNTAMYHLQ